MELISIITGIFIGIIISSLLFIMARKQRYNMYWNLRRSSISLYSTERAEKDTKSGKYSGKAASILKWKKIVHAMNMINSAVASPCGLCYEFADPNCLICPLNTMTGQNCTISTSQYQRTYTSIRNAQTHTKKMLNILKKV